MGTTVTGWARLLACILLAVAMVSAQPRAVSPPRVPGNLQAPSGEEVLLKALGKGVQIYVCKANAANPGSFAWVFTAPEATLTDQQGDTIGKHYAGPTWEAKDGSKVVGEILQKTNAPRAGAVPWLLLKAKSHQGVGTFAPVTYIQRVDTTGGNAPASGCDQAHSGVQARVSYRANYYFFITGKR